MDKVEMIKDFIVDNKKKFIIGISGFVLFSLLSFGVFYYYKNKETHTVLYESNLEEKNEVKIEEPKEYYYVDIKGLVNNPGVYSIEKGKRVVDALNQAGGLQEDANTSLLNLSMMIKDQMVIKVYSNKEINDLSETIKKEQKQDTLCKSNDACTTTSKSTVVPKLEQKSSTNDNVDISSEKININTATKDLLMTLSKIGESKAISIIEYREANGEFKTIEDIKNVSGIGDSIFESIKDYITV